MILRKASRFLEEVVWARSDPDDLPAFQPGSTSLTIQRRASNFLEAMILALSCHDGLLSWLLPSPTGSRTLGYAAGHLSRVVLQDGQTWRSHIALEKTRQARLTQGNCTRGETVLWPSVGLCWELPCSMADFCPSVYWGAGV
jgi:hypothetical protein